MEQQVKFKHFRKMVPVGDWFFAKDEVSNFGGVTMAYIEVEQPDGKVSLVAGFSVCSGEDNFSRSKGREIALKRLKEKPVSLDDWQREELMLEHTLNAVDYVLEEPLLQQGLRIQACW